jgi:hypothetical protein
MPVGARAGGWRSGAVSGLRSPEGGGVSACASQWQGFADVYSALQYGQIIGGPPREAVTFQGRGKKGQQGNSKFYWELSGKSQAGVDKQL